MKIVFRPGASNLFGPALKWAREQARPHLSQADLAARITLLGLPMDRSTISRIENQERSLKDFEFLLFTTALRVDPVKLFQFAFRRPSELSLYEEIASDSEDLLFRVAEDEEDPQL
ncbi:MAG TPA: helix-turn-helix transcriptional regulator [Oceanipulchritudo sp.]|nr:helix-turn-helix transcriptional regulator [Oceanipulchritudo sp.]